MTLYIPLGKKNGDGIGACVLCKYEFCCKNPLMELGDACCEATFADEAIAAAAACDEK